MGNEKEEVTEDKIIEQNDDDQIQNELNRLNEEMNHNQDENVANEQENESVVVAVENDYGYSTVHDAYKQYFGVHNAECTAAPKLLLFAKKNGISGVTFANANKYLKARKKDSNAVSLEDLANTKHPQIQNNNNADHEEEHDIISPKAENENGADSDGSVHSGHSEHYQAETISSDQTKADTPPITITQSMTDKHKTPTPEAPLQHETDDNKNNNDNNDDDDVKQQQEVKKKSNLEVKPKKKKKKKTLFVAAEMLGKLKKATLYTRFELPLYILELNVAQKKKQKDEKRMIRDMGLQLGYKVQLKQQNMKGTIKFIGSVHFTYGVIVGLEMTGNGNGKHQGDIDKIKYFDSKRNGGLFVRVD